MQHNLRKVYTKRTEHIGHRVFFCEGSTEYNYVKVFADILNRHTPLTDIHVLQDTVGSNARAVFNFASKHLESPDLQREYIGYTPCLIFDCDAPDNIQSVIDDAVSSEHNFIVYISNIIFEVWLLMFFEDVDSKLSKKMVYTKLQTHLSLDDWDKYKASYGKMQEIFQTGDLLKAIACASHLQNRYDTQGLFYTNSIALMNPFTNIHQLTIMFLNELQNSMYRADLPGRIYDVIQKLLITSNISSQPTNPDTGSVKTTIFS